MLDKKDPQTVGQTFANGRLQQLVGRAERLRRISAWLLEQLPPEFAYRCQVLNIKPPTLILGAKDNATAMQLKYHQWEILDCIEKHPDLNQVTQLQIKICP